MIYRLAMFLGFKAGNVVPWSTVHKPDKLMSKADRELLA